MSFITTNRYLIGMLVICIFTLTSCVNEYTRSLRMGAKESYQNYLSACKPGEIRCLYFDDDDPLKGEAVIIALDAATYTPEDMSFYVGSHRGIITHKLGSADAVTMKQLASELPPSNIKVPYNRSLFVSVHDQDGIQIHQYLQAKPPLAVKKIYRIMGEDLAQR